MAAFHKVEVALNKQSITVGSPSPQTVNVVVPTRGPKGDTGDTGPTGPANSLSIGTVTTGAAGSSASATITGTAPDQTLDLAIPRGDKGDKGDTGDTGATGATGPANTLTIGTVTTGAEGDPAAATITGDAPNQTLSLTLPVGATGATGPQGPAGEQTTDASLLTSGTLADARLSSNVALEDTANTFSQNQTLNGTNNVAPNQTAASDASLMTRSLVDARTAGYLFCERGFYIITPLQGIFTNVGSGSGTINQSGVGGFRVATGTTASSSSLYRANPGAIMRFGRTNNTAGIQWSRTVTLGWDGQIDVRTNGVLRLQFGRANNATTIADLSGLGIGLIWDGTTGTVTAEVHNGTTRNTGSCGTFTNTFAIWTSVRMVSSGGTLTVYINDSLAGTVSGAPTSDAGTTANNIHLSIENGAATTSYFADNPAGFRVFVA